MQLGRYRLDEQVGQGGMAVVWRGFDLQLKRTVAVKVLHPHLHGREEIRKRFAREAQAVARLHHPHILDVFDSSDPDAEPSWLVMEFVLGQNLRAFAEAHPFDPPELAAACLVPVADALEHAHQGGVIHRDLKPENVMVRDDGTVKLTDFGIAAIVEPDEKFTATGQILGSPAHLAPEIIEGKPATAQSDLFSLGTMLYWLSCGKLPFLAPTPAALLRLIMVCQPTDPRMIKPSISDGQARLILKCLSREPAARPSSAAALVRELTALLAEAGIDHPIEEVATFVRSKPPEAHGKLLRDRLIERSLRQGEEAMAARRTTQALAAFSRALSLDPKNDQARAEVERIHQRSRRSRLVRRGALGASLALLLGVGGSKASSLWRQRAEVPAGPIAADPGRLAGQDADAGAPAQTASADSPSATSTQDAAAPAPAEVPAARPTGAPTRSTQRGGRQAKAGQRVAQVVPAVSEDPDGDPADEPVGRPSRRPGTQARETPSQPAEARPAAVLVEVRLPLPAQLTVDGKDYGTEPMFKLKLTPGVHRFTVQKGGFDAADSSIVIRSGPQEPLRLNLGAPRPALITVTGAPPDAIVKVPGAFSGTVADLAREPATVPMKGLRVREVEITVGDKTFKWKLKAGQEQAFDYAKHVRDGDT